MPVSDVDTEMLEAFLDGELTEAQAEAVRQRLADDLVFGKALSELVAERATREHYYDTLQQHDSVEDESVGRLIAGVEHELDRDERRAMARSDRRRMIGYITAAAACVMFSFSAGWIGHRHASDQTPLGGRLVASQNSNDALTSGTTALVGNVRDVRGPGVDVTITDQLGRFIAVQHFDSIPEAQQFVHEVGSEQQQQQNRPVDTVLNKAQF